MLNISTESIGWVMLVVMVIYLIYDAYTSRVRDQRQRDKWSADVKKLGKSIKEIVEGQPEPNPQMEKALATLGELEKTAVAELHTTQEAQKKLEEQQLRLAQEMTAITQTAGASVKELQEVKAKIKAIAKANKPKKALHKAHSILLDKFRAAGSMVSTSSQRFDKLEEDLFSTVISREDNSSKISRPTRMGAKVTDEIISAEDDAELIYVGNHELTPAQAVVVATCLLEWASHGRLIFGDPSIEPDELVVTPSGDDGELTDEEEDFINSEGADDTENENSSELDIDDEDEEEDEEEYEEDDEDEEEETKW